ncbi:hypothetical protein A6X20_40935 [Bradyrhizobium elkanii]|nr:hypothetical protein A6X20_40935 [Bradyrhizobium elkanii]ODM79368.1 hypothetical protein A6452_28375 [Bradyrhizobium elkanii]
MLRLAAAQLRGLVSLFDHSPPRRTESGDPREASREPGGLRQTLSACDKRRMEVLEGVGFSCCLRQARDRSQIGNNL